MSERWARSCRGKRHYNSERRAQEAAKSSQIMYKQTMNAYPCEFCPGKWVTGSTYPWEGKEARREKTRNSQQKEIDSDYSV